MLTSLIVNNPEFNYDFKILTYDHIQDSEKTEFFNIYKNIEFEIINTDTYESKLNQITNKRFNTTSYNALFRFEMFNYEQYDKLIYLDSDIIINANIDYLIHDCIERECYAVKHEERNCFNAGVLIFNKKTTFNEYKTRCLNFINDKKKLLPGNQEVFNKCFNALYIDCKYNLTVAYKECDYLIDTDNVVIYHYPGDGKPWLDKKFSDWYAIKGSEKAKNIFINVWNYYESHYQNLKNKKL